MNDSLNQIRNPQICYYAVIIDITTLLTFKKYRYS